MSSYSHQCWANTNGVQYNQSSTKRCVVATFIWSMLIQPHNNRINPDWQSRGAPLPAGYAERYKPIDR